MKISKKMWSNILFFGFIIFLFTPWGSPIKTRLSQGVTYIKSFIMPTSAKEVGKRVEMVSLNMELKGISSASNINLETLKGKVIFINYWATWCGPCKAEMPSIQALYNDYKDKITFLFITNDEKSKVENFYTKNNYKLPTYNLSSASPEQISTRSIPATFVIDKSGKLALKEFGASNWNSSSVRKMLDDLLAE